MKSKFSKLVVTTFFLFSSLSSQFLQLVIADFSFPNTLRKGMPPCFQSRSPWQLIRLWIFSYDFWPFVSSLLWGDDSSPLPIMFGVTGLYSTACYFLILDTDHFLVIHGGQKKVYSVSTRKTVYSCIIINYCIIFHTNNCKPTFANPYIFYTYFCSQVVVFFSFESFDSVFM